jgi:hypothetical protein
MWYPPRPNDDASVFDEIYPATSFSVSKLMVRDKTASASAVDGGSLWKNWHVNDEHCNDIKNNPPVKDDRLNYLISNNWHSIPKSIASSSRRQYIHGVEVRKLEKDHFLCGEHGLFSTRKFSRFDIIGEYTGMVVGSTVNGHYVAARSSADVYRLIPRRVPRRYVVSCSRSYIFQRRLRADSQIADCISVLPSPERPHYRCGGVWVKPCPAAKFLHQPIALPVRDKSDEIGFRYSRLV